MTTQITLFYTFRVAFHVAVMGEDTNFKFCIEVDHKFSPTNG